MYETKQRRRLKAWRWRRRFDQCIMPLFVGTVGCVPYSDPRRAEHRDEMRRMGFHRHDRQSYVYWQECETVTPVCDPLRWWACT